MDKLVYCPLKSNRVCLEAVFGDRAQFDCAWWIPGAECCAVVQIARKLHNMAVLEIFKAEGVAYG